MLKACKTSLLYKEGERKEKWPKIFCSGPEKRHIPHKVVDSGNGVFRIEFTTVEVSLFLFSQSSDLPLSKFEEPFLTFSYRWEVM